MINLIQNVYYFLLTIFWGEEGAERSFRKLLGKSEKILVILPLEKEIAGAAAASLKKLLESGKKISILVHHDLRSVCPNDYRLDYREFYQNDIFLGRIPKFSFLKRLRAFHFDLVLDLDITGGAFASFCVLPVRCNCKVGVNRAKFDKSYSLQLQKISGEPSAIAQNCVDLLFSL